MMRVAMISSGDEKCGIAAYSWDLVKALGKKSKVEYLAFPRAEQKDEWLRLAKKINDEFDIAHIQYHPQFCGYWRHPFQLLRFHSFMKSLSKPLVVTIHDLLDHWPVDTARHLPPFYSAAVNAFLKHAPGGRFFRAEFLNAADHIIIHWKGPERPLLSVGIVPEKISALYPGVPALELDSREVEEARALLKGRQAAGIFGFIRAHKGFETALEALKILPEPVVLLAVGEVVKGNEAYLEELKRLISSLGLEKRVIFTGFVSEKKAFALLSQCRVILLPYVPTMETASYSLSCALAADRPIIASDANFFKEINSRYGVPAIFERNNARQLAHEISRLTDGDPDLDRNLALFRQEWSWDRVVEKTIRIYDEAIARHAGKKQEGKHGA